MEIFTICVEFAERFIAGFVASMGVPLLALVVWSLWHGECSSRLRIALAITGISFTSGAYQYLISTLAPGPAPTIDFPEWRATLVGLRASYVTFIAWMMVELFGWRLAVLLAVATSLILVVYWTVGGP